MRLYSNLLIHSSASYQIYYRTDESGIGDSALNIVLGVAVGEATEQTQKGCRKAATSGVSREAIHTQTRERAHWFGAVQNPRIYLPGEIIAS